MMIWLALILLQAPILQPNTERLQEIKQLAEQLPLVQRFPSHLQRVLQPAHEMLVTSGLVRGAVIEQDGKSWVVGYRLSHKED